ncbi:TIGR00300 family protein [bacterium]|nr:MAG: TIGR00300 family protein [bacterium]
MRTSATVELRGHLIDSGIFQRVLETMADADAEYTIDVFDVGRTKTDPSYARVTVFGLDPEPFAALLDDLRATGATVLEDADARTEPAPAGGVLPDDFYATTNLETEVRLRGEWVPVALPEMDCAIVVRDGRPITLAGYDVRAGEAVVVGHEGVRVKPLERPRNRAVFEFMSSAVSSEKPKESLVVEIARELRACLDTGKRVLVVGGPAVVHTGAARYLAALIREGYVNALFAGNALAVHDIESQFFGTSLGVDLDNAYPVEHGHVHHLRTVNRVRTVGGIQAAIDCGALRGGIMYEAYRARIPVVLAGSIRDDGPLPDVITDVVEAQKAMRAVVPEVGVALMICTLLHSIAVGNMLPASVRVVNVDINPASVTKLSDRGSFQTIGLVTDAAAFLRELCAALKVGVEPPSPASPAGRLA